MDDDELADIEAAARRDGETVSAWVRRTLRAAQAQRTASDASRRLAAVREAMTHDFPTGDIEQLIEETQRGYLR